MANAAEFPARRAALAAAAKGLTLEVGKAKRGDDPRLEIVRR